LEHSVEVHEEGSTYTLLGWYLYLDGLTALGLGVFRTMEPMRMTAVDSFAAGMEYVPRSTVAPTTVVACHLHVYHSCSYGVHAVQSAPTAPKISGVRIHARAARSTFLSLDRIVSFPFSPSPLVR